MLSFSDSYYYDYYLRWFIVTINNEQPNLTNRKIRIYFIGCYFNVKRRKNTNNILYSFIHLKTCGAISIGKTYCRVRGEIEQPFM